VSASHNPRSSLVFEVEALVAAYMADASLTEIIPIVDRLKAAVDRWDEIPPAAIAELRSAIDQMRGGQACATIRALLAAHSELNVTPCSEH
jgi:hypothetical protein